MKPALLFLGLVSTALLVSASSHAAVWKVGPTRTYTLPSQVAGLVANGDVVEIDAAIYIDCASWNANNLTLKGVGGRPHIQNKVCAGKGIWNLNGQNTTIENIEFSGATNPDQNGAGIRGVGGGFTVRSCYFHHNDNGILASPAGALSAGQGEVLVELSEFSENGFGDGLSHNLYIGNFQKFTLQYCYVHRAKVGHEVKSRAYNNYILYNRISDELSNASRNIDLPNGGIAYIIGNVIEQGPNSPQSNIIGYGLEGLSNPAPHSLFLVNNTMVNNRTNGGSFVMVPSGTGLLKIVNTIFAGNGTLLSGTPTTLDSAHNLVRTNIASVGFKNPSTLDYELTSTSPAIHKGISPGHFGAFSLAPVAEYVHPAGKRDRVSNGMLDIGAYEFHANPLALETEDKQQAVASFFPNPFHESFTVVLPKAAHHIIVRDLCGIEVLNMPASSANRSVEMGQELAKGSYTITVHYASGETETSRILKLE